MKKTILFKLFSILAIIIISSCESDSEIINNSTFDYSKTQISINNKNTIVVTENTTYDFNDSTIFLSKGIEIIDDKIVTEKNSNLWFIPFDKNEKPILMRTSFMHESDVTISCDCPSGGIGGCDVEGTNNGGSTTYRCDGGCTNGSCEMTVTIKHIDAFKISTGMFISSDEVIFNGNVYK